MRVEQLKCLVDISQTGSLTATAKHLFISQQAVSKSIKQLEEELGVGILVRTKKGVFLTTEGLEVVDFAKKVLAEEKSLQLKLSTRQNEGAFWGDTKINIGTTSSILNVILPNIFTELQAQGALPTIRVFAEYDFEKLLAKIKQGRYDIGLTAIRLDFLAEKLEEYKDELAGEILLNDELVVTMNRKFYDSNETKFDNDSFGRMPIKTSYDILALSDEIKERMYHASLIASNDADFHRSMMDKIGARTLMSGLAHRMYFKNKKYIALPFEKESFSLVHAAIYRKDAKREIGEFVSMIHRELYMK